MSKRNPDPVIVGLVFTEPGKLLIIKRNIEPFKGGLALPGGYIERGEDWRLALQRELIEEANVHVSVDPAKMKIYDVRSTPDGDKLLIFATIQASGIVRVDDFTPNKEVSARFFADIGYYITVHHKMCFPLHAQVVEMYWKKNYDFESAHPGGW